MLRATNCVFVRTLLLRRLPTDLQIAAISQCPPSLKKIDPRLREPCPPPPVPPPKRPRSDAWLWGTVFVVLITGTIVVYCKSSPELRDWLSLNAPILDDVIAVLYQEDMTYKEFAVQSTEQIKGYFNSSPKPKAKQCSMPSKPPGDEPKTPKGAVVKREGGLSDCKPLLPTDVLEIENCMKDFGETIVFNLEAATDACRDYNNLVAAEMQDFKLNRMKALRVEMEKRKELVQTCVKKACTAFEKLEGLSKFLDCGVQATKEELERHRASYRSYLEKAKFARLRYQWQNDKSLAADKQWQTVEKTMSNYVKQNESMFPGLKYDAKHITFNGDMDVLLLATARYMNSVEDELKTANQNALMRINRALDNVEPQPKDDRERKQKDYRVQSALKKKVAESDANYDKRVANLKTDNEKQLQELLCLQKARHEAMIEQKLQAKEAEFAVKYTGLIQEEVIKETKPLADQLVAMMEKLKVVETSLNARLNAERETRRSQELWTAGAALLAATRKGEQYVKVDKELKAIEKAACGDKLVKTVLLSIPQSVRDQGLVPESVLKANYREMEKVALKVALVDSEGAPLHVYILSWIQNALLFMKMTGIPQAEFEKPPKEPPKELDTFDLLQRARFWMDHGNLPAALKHVNSLSGASRAAANKWYEQARAHLEVRQAADAILAHAAAMGLQYI